MFIKGNDDCGLDYESDIRILPERISTDFICAGDEPTHTAVSEGDYVRRGQQTR